MPQYPKDVLATQAALYMFDRIPARRDTPVDSQTAALIGTQMHQMFERMFAPSTPVQVEVLHDLQATR
ncbi:hypothetical protein [Leifsonia sp. Leaf264]|uniref:hypothetical protein n=1 Tax=Leifsonia sp. Leaf264 TaxID=1736314 RepID=UPI0006F21304|nr:hypothetical protein [Leifsonia sp. Leaf264]KQO98409.1 hypothetical protein ASF30_10130 [Leifsonia sp. Leaf264]